jgi:TonB family protein
LIYDAPALRAICVSLLVFLACVLWTRGSEAQVGAVIEAPRIKTAAEAHYPEGTRGLEREVIVLVTIEADGQVSNADLVDGSVDALDDVALEAARRYEFFPAKRDGKPLKSRIKLKLALHGPPSTEVSDAGAPPATPDASVAAADAGTADAAPARVAKRTDDVEDVRVHGEKVSDSPTVRSLDRAEIEMVPGALGDAIRPIESLPGVSRAPAFSGLVILRGSAPEDSQIFIDQAAVPLAFHFGGLAAVIPTELVNTVDVYPGNYDVQYGRGIGGIVDIGLRSPARDRIHAVAKFDAIDGSAVVEGPLFDNKTRFLIAARRSWIEAYFPALAQALALGVTASPVYYDGQAMLERDIGKHATLRLTFLGSSDRVLVTLAPSQSTDPGFSGLFSDETTFWRLQLQADAKLKDGTKLFAQVSVGQDDLLLNLGSQLNANSTATRVQGRAQADVPITKGLRLKGGFDVEGGQWNYTLMFPQIPGADSPDTGPLFGQTTLTSVRSYGYFDPGAFANVELDPMSRMRVLVGARVDAFGSTSGVYLQPRMNMRWTVRGHEGDRTTLKGAFGLYAQAPQVYQTDPVFGTPGIGAEEATQISFGVVQELLHRVEVSVEPFYKNLFDLVSQRPDPTTPSGSRYGNEGTGFAYGVEFLLKYKPDKHFMGWIAYTLSRSERRDLPEDPLHLFEYDQTHVFSALGTYSFGNGWSVGLRVRYVTGNPYTPIIGGYFDSNAGDYGPVDKLPVYTARLPAFFSMDVRVEKKWHILKDSQLSLYLDVLNATNNRNVESLTFNYDYQINATAAGLPILPSFGARLEL